MITNVGDGLTKRKQKQKQKQKQNKKIKQNKTLLMEGWQI